MGESSKQGIQAVYSALIHHVKWWWSRFRGVYRAFRASVGNSFWYYLKAFGHYLMSHGAPCWLLWALCIWLCILLLLLSLLLLLLLLLLMSFLLFLLSLEFLSRALYCSYEVSWPFGFASFNFFICLNLIHATTSWCWRAALIIIWHHLIMMRWRQGT